MEVVQYLVQQEPRLKLSPNIFCIQRDDRTSFQKKNFPHSLQKEEDKQPKQAQRSMPFSLSLSLPQKRKKKKGTKGEPRRWGGNKTKKNKNSLFLSNKKKGKKILF